MARSKLARILDFIQGSHHMGDDGLRDYFAALAVSNGSRCRANQKRLNVIKSALHPYHVIVSLDGEQVRLYRADLQAEIRL